MSGDAPRRDAHPTLTPEERRALLREGVERYRAGDFFGAHESWEEVWRSTTPEPKELLQGLIQVAAALYAWRDLGRVDGPRRTLERGLARISSHRGVGLGIDLATVVAGAERWRVWLADGAIGEPPPWPVVDVEDATALR